MTRTVLIVDSSSVTCHTVSKQLRAVGFDTLQARSVAGARAALASNPVDLIILDLATTSASDAGGMALLLELPRDRAGRKAPVIILTSSARDSDRVNARAAGAVAFLTKPVSTRELLLTVNNALALHAPAHQTPMPHLVERDAAMTAPFVPPTRNRRPGWGVSPARPDRW